MSPEAREQFYNAIDRLHMGKATQADADLYVRLRLMQRIGVDGPRLPASMLTGMINEMRRKNPHLTWPELPET